MKKRVRYIYLAFALSFIVTIVISIIYLSEFSSLQKSNERLQLSQEIRNHILKVQSNLIEAENSQRGFLLTEDKELLLPLTLSQKNIFNEIEILKNLTKTVPEQQQIIAKLKQTISQRYRVLYETIDAEAGADLQLFVKNADRGKRIMKEFMTLSNKFDELEAAQQSKRERENQLLEIVTSYYLKIVLVLSILFQFISFLIMIKAFRRRKENQIILESKIKELNLSNSEMEQIAFVASHDLQEPLRKIRTFSDKLIKSHFVETNNEGQKLLNKITTTSQHMQELLNDFIKYTRLVKNAEGIEPVHLKKVLEDVCAEFKGLIETKKATLLIDDLPVVNGYNYQLHLLFSNLLENALKFAKEEVPLVIRISFAKMMKGKKEDEREFSKITFSDNGIGFEKEFEEKIFIIFQRLHSQSSQYLGKGIGLAICKRIMMNHNGFIESQGEVGVGATFHLYFLINTG